ncbi:unnamed protein product [Calypogeia fissa]
MPALGFHPWDTLCDDLEYPRLLALLTVCHSNNDVVSWSSRVLKKLHAGEYLKLDSREMVDLKQCATILKSIFYLGGSFELEGVTAIVVKHRKQIADEAIHWLRAKKKVVFWEAKHGWTTYDSLAQEEYKTWKAGEKPTSCATTHTNLAKAYQVLTGCSEEDARLQVLFGHGSYVGITLCQTIDNPTNPCHRPQPQAWAVSGDGSILLGETGVAKEDCDVTLSKHVLPSPRSTTRTGGLPCDGSLHHIGLFFTNATLYGSGFRVDGG